MRAFALPSCNTFGTITIRLPAKLESALRARLDRRRVSVSTFVRDVIAEKLERPMNRGHPHKGGAPLTSDKAPIRWEPSS
jgi:hypothetical protein